MLNTGTKLGPYEILGAAGAGGMGEVYRARDTRLERTVAIKVLPEQFSQNPDLKQRFEREARAISSLNHPNICTLYDVGHQDGTDYLVLEYIEGESLSSRLMRGPLPVEQVLKTGTEIAEALEKAHRQGIVHRDLKPGNVMLTKSGAKLLDFGLAKPAGGAMQPGSALTQAVTQTSPVSPITQQGMLVGTFQYMAPEQVEGKEADARSDIFALGAVLYEMATGKRAFEGKSAISVASAILEKEPEPISKVQPLTPPALEHVVHTCLAKDADQRWQSAADVARELRWISESGSQAGVSALPGRARQRRRERAVWAAAVVALLAAVAALAFLAFRPQPSLHAEIVAPAGASFDFMGDTSAPPALSPDGTQLVFGAHTAKDPQALWVRTLETGMVQRLAGTDGAIFPFWSPDSRWIAFFAGGKLKKVRSYGGPVADIADAPNAPRGGAWLSEEVIVYAPDFAGALWRVGASGGTPVQQTKLEAQTTHRWPIALPDGKHFLYYATSHTDPSGPGTGIYFAALDGSVNKLVVSSDAGGFYSGGYLLYHQQNSLVAQRFEPTSGMLRSDPVVITDDVAYDPGTWHLLVAASQSGVLAYQRGTSSSGAQLTWMDRSGKTLSPLGGPANYNGYSISPDGKRVAAAIIGRTSEIYLLDVERGLSTRLSFDSLTAHALPSWSADGKRVVYDAGNSSGIGVGQPPALYAKPVTGSGGETLLYRPESGGASWPKWSPDGRYLVFIHASGPSGAQVEALPVGGGKPFVVAKPETAQGAIQTYDLSRDGRWIAYSSNESGGTQVFVSAFPSGSGRWQVSSQGGNSAVWSRNSDELFFQDNNFNLAVATYSGQGSDFAITGIKQLFTLHATPGGGTSFDVSPDGKRFLIDVVSQESSAPLDLVLNWTSELKK